MVPSNAPKPRRTGLALVVACVAIVGVTIPVWRARMATPGRARKQEHSASSEQQPTPVPINSEEPVIDGYRGGVHPLLRGQTKLPLTAHWSPVGQDPKYGIEKRVAPATFRLLSELRPAVPEKVYTERDFSAFLMPESSQTVGQVWELDGDKIIEMLSQFDPRVSMQVESWGRRAGPNGAFGLLRAVSPTHLDIVFRIHAEFGLSKTAWVTPACFWGRMIIDKAQGTVASFQLSVPHEHYLNVHVTVKEDFGKGEDVREIVNVERMELASANVQLAETLKWTQSIEMTAAQNRLKKVFYIFENIDWVPWQDAPRIAETQKKPILAIVLWGALDDQSC